MDATCRCVRVHLPLILGRLSRASAGIARLTVLRLDKGVGEEYKRVGLKYALTFACDYGYLELARDALRNGAIADGGDLDYCLNTAGHMRLARLLLDAGAKRLEFGITSAQRRCSNSFCGVAGRMFVVTIAVGTGKNIGSGTAASTWGPFELADS